MLRKFNPKKGRMTEPVSDDRLFDRLCCIYDWVCRRCMKGYFSQDIEKSNENSEPLCPNCKSVLK